MEHPYLVDHQHLTILFHLFQGEYLLDALLGKGGKSCNSKEITESCYANCGISHWKEYSHSELYNMCGDLNEKIKEPSQNGVSRNTQNVFGYLARVGKKLLRQYEDTVVCKFEQVTEFRNISLLLGQDILTTSFLAHEDHVKNYKREYFCWQGIIPTDNSRLKHLFSKGISENHFHLNGSVPVFFLSWICLMNQPRSIKGLFQSIYVKNKLADSLSPMMSYQANTLTLSLEEKIILCSYIRGKLFKRLKTNHPFEKNEFLDFHSTPSKVSEVGTFIEGISLYYGQKMPTASGSYEVLDYAISQEDITSQKQLNHHNRAYSGERYLLYHCFKSIFQGKFTDFEEDIFYLYLETTH